MKILKCIVLFALSMSLAGCSYNSCFVIVNLTGHDLVVLYKFKPGTTYSTALSNTPRVLSFKVHGSDYMQDSLQQELTFDYTDTVKVRVPHRSMFSGAESAHAFLDYSFDKVDWLMIIRTDLGDTLKVSGSMITDIIQEVNDQDMGWVIDYQPQAVPKEEMEPSPLRLSTSIRNNGMTGATATRVESTITWDGSAHAGCFDVYGPVTR